MALSIRDVRHIALVTLIIAALPMLAYPYALEFNFELGPLWYIVLELAFFFMIASFLNRRKAVMVTIVTVLFYFLGRLFLSSVLLLFLLSLERVTFSTALSSAFSTFTLALLLFTLSTPFLFNSTIQSLLGGRSRDIKVRKVGMSPAGRPRVTPQPSRHVEVPLSSAGTPRAAGEFFDRSFDDAVQHVGGYSGVLCVLLIDGEGLPVAGWNRGTHDQEMWGALAKKIVDEVEEINCRAGSSRLETLEFKSGEQRFCLYRVADMWLLSIADAASDELEKIRVHQAAEMIERHFQEKFKNVYSTETGRKYAGSTV